MLMTSNVGLVDLRLKLSIIGLIDIRLKIKLNDIKVVMTLVITFFLRREL